MGESVLGAFAVHRAAPSPVTPETASLLGSLAAQAAIALENARLYSETARRLEETGALLEVVEILNSTLDTKRLLKRVAIKIAEVCRVDRCSLVLWEGGQVAPLVSQYADGRKAPAQWVAFQAVASRPGPAAERMRQVAREVALACGADMVGAYFLDERKEKLAPLGGYQVPPELLAWFMTRPIVLARVPELLSAWREGRAVWSSDPLNDPRFDPD